MVLKRILGAKFLKLYAFFLDVGLVFYGVHLLFVFVGVLSDRLVLLSLTKGIKLAAFCIVANSKDKTQVRVPGNVNTYMLSGFLCSPLTWAWISHN